MAKSTVNKAGNYTKPTMRKNLFNRIKAGGKGGPPGVWSARKAQMLAKSYKAKGGGYKEMGGLIEMMANGGMAPSQKSLKTWTDADWGYISKGDRKKPKSQRGRYLPKSVRESLTPAQKASENRKKRAASSKGKVKAKYSKDVAKKVTAASKFSKGGKTPAWQRKEGKNPSGGLNKKGVASYRAANPGSKLKTAVTTKPSKLKPGSKAANRRKSFCARMSGMKKKLTSAKTANDPNSRINKSLRKWNCEDGGYIETTKKRSITMPQGMGTYGSKVGRPKKKMMGHGGPNMKKKMDNMMDKMMYGGPMKKKMKHGGMMKVDAAKNPGLSKLPKKVRNKMGYMKDGGKTKKMMYGGSVSHSGGGKAAGDVTQVYSSSGNYKMGQ
tara:strand:- start:9621 stop:10766 length:1146 start_codon:yes stop_codon:yes gene_type:complete